MPLELHCSQWDAIGQPGAFLCHTPTMKDASDFDGFTEEELRWAEEQGLEFLIPPAPELPPVRYSGNEEYIAFNWSAVVNDFMLLAHPWAQQDHISTENRARAVLEENDGVIDTPEAFKEFLECFSTSPTYERIKSNGRSRSIPPSVRKRVFERDGEECQFCGSCDDLCLDHIKPFSRGGRHHIGNLRALCRSCNSSRGDKTDEEWLREGA